MIEPIKWCAHPLGIIHEFKWRNFITDQLGGPRFGVVMLHLRQHHCLGLTCVGAVIVAIVSIVMPDLRQHHCLGLTCVGAVIFAIVSIVMPDLRQRHRLV